MCWRILDNWNRKLCINLGQAFFVRNSIVVAVGKLEQRLFVYQETLENRLRWKFRAGIRIYLFSAAIRAWRINVAFGSGRFVDTLEGPAAQTYRSASSSAESRLPRKRTV